MSMGNGKPGRVDVKQSAQLAPLIDRNQVINFIYDGKTYQGFAGRYAGLCAVGQWH